MTEIWMAHQEWLDARRYGRDEQCAGQLRIVDQTDPIWTIRCDTCRFEAGVPASQVSPEQRHALAVRTAELPAMFVGKPYDMTAETLEARNAVREWALHFDEHPTPAPALYGLPGRGKTHLMVAACEQIIQRHRPTVWFQTVAGLTDLLMAAFEQRNEHQRIWERATTCDLLVLDDIGAEQVTDWRVERIYRLVDERYQYGRPILLATNLPPSGWTECLDPRTVSRLLEMTTPVELGGHDRRTVLA